MSPQFTPIEQALKLRPIAIVGASADPSKYGNIVLRDLRKRGWTTYAINPRGVEIDGEPAYASLQECPALPELVVFITPPAVTLSVLDQVKALGIGHVWFQPGAASEDVIARATELSLGIVDDCIMVQAARHHA